MMDRFKKVGVATALFFFLSGGIQAVPQVKLRRSQESRIAFLRWKAFRVQEGSPPLVVLSGQYAQPGASLFWNGRKINSGADSAGNFQFTFPIEEPLTQIDIVAEMEDGSEQREQVIVQSSPQGLKTPMTPAAAVSKKEGRNWILFVGVGHSYNDYAELTETGLRTYLGHGFETLAAFSMKLSPHFGVTSQISFTAVPFLVQGAVKSETLTVASTATMRALEANARVGYLFPFIHPPIKFALYGGFYYSTLFVTESAFGYRNLLGPQLYPQISLDLGSRHVLKGFVKYSPIFDGLGLRPLGDRKLSFGGGWGMLLPNGHPLSLQFEYMDVSLNFTTTLVSSISYVTTIQYGF